jgi:signal transduction histidine kinase
MATRHATPEESALRLASALLESAPAGVACIDAEQRVVLANPAFEALRPQLPRIAAATREVIASGAPDELDLGPELGRVRLFRIDERHAAVVAAVDAQRADEQAALRRVATLVARDAPDSELFAAVAEQVAATVGAEASAVLRFDGPGRAVVVGVWRQGGTRGMPLNAELDFDATNSALGRALVTRQPARADSYDGLRGELPIVMRSIDLRSSVVAPVMLGGEVWGAIDASTTRDEPLPPGTEHRLDAFAELVGQALENAAALRRQAASHLGVVEAADASRRRLERELHEGAQQHIVALALKLRVARSRAGDDPVLAGLLDEALTEALEANSSLRELARDLHPAALTTRGLAAAIQGIAARSTVPVHLRELPGRRFAASIEATAYFVISEALDNAADHAEATEAVVAVSDRGDRLVVELSDDGVGGADAQAGSTLRGLADRAAALGGTLEISSPPGGGTVVRAELPLVS